MGTATGTAVFMCLLATPVLALGLWRRWLVLLALPLILWIDVGFYNEFTDPTFGRAVVNEMGYGWMVRQMVAANLPIVAVIVVVVSRSHRFPTPGHCTVCGYSLYGLPEPRCPECGTRITSASEHDPTRPA